MVSRTSWANGDEEERTKEKKQKKILGVTESFSSRRHGDFIFAMRYPSMLSLLLSMCF